MENKALSLNGMRRVSRLLNSEIQCPANIAEDNLDRPGTRNPCGAGGESSVGGEVGRVDLGSICIQDCQGRCATGDGAGLVYAGQCSTVLPGVLKRLRDVRYARGLELEIIGLIGNLRLEFRIQSASAAAPDNSREQKNNDGAS